MRRLVIPTIEALAPYKAGTPVAQVAASHGFAESDIVKLASNENPLGSGEKAVVAARLAAEELGRYPDPSAPQLRTALATQLGVAVEEIVVGNGSNELLDLLVRTFCTADGHVVFAEPAFVVYRLACMAHGVPFTAVPLQGWTHDLPQMAKAVTDKTQLVFIANPNNPTGTDVTREQVVEFLAAVPRHIVVVLDEAYIEYVESDDFPDGLSLRQLHPRLVITRTFSKVHGLAALRVGYAIMAEELANYIHRVRAPFNVGSIGQAAAVAALEDVDHVSRSRILNSKEKQFMRAQLSSLGLEVVPSEANFLLVNTPKPGGEMYNALLQHGVIVRPIPPLPQALRITMGTRRQNELCIAALKAELL